MSSVLLILSGLALTGWIYLALFHGWFWRLLLDEGATERAVWPSIDIVVPARNEASMLPRTLASLAAQDYPGEWNIILVDDHSDDGTGEIARNLGGRRVRVIVPPPLAPGWSGKVAAMQAGVEASRAEYVLFTDADIEHSIESLRRLAARAEERDLALTSRMVRLHCGSSAEKLLVPAFVFFFAMLYPFRRAEAAAGGVMLVRRGALDAIGGLARICGALIDDCSLARTIKEDGGRIELTLTKDIRSLREYPGFSDFHRMVARSAYTQLNYSIWLLVGTCIGMGLLFLLPPIAALAGSPIGAAAWLVMAAIYVPMVRFYGLGAWWALTLPAAAVLYVAATIDSARLHWMGRGGQWKGRSQII